MFLNILHCHLLYRRHLETIQKNLFPQSVITLCSRRDKSSSRITLEKNYPAPSSCHTWTQEPMLGMGSSQNVFTPHTIFKLGKSSFALAPPLLDFLVSSVNCFKIIGNTHPYYPTCTPHNFPFSAHCTLFHR
ncbi:hypothetical protein, unlikely [Trypanosoma congolense IL3000]|uniref:Uncharacterized protein n=1 Tax=Trypanosoma congolense (strain IL3000) TaxID=1068625 RepID=F9W9N6_TRYCI|nr:hypothetical protein, unlikely [Trypanosoma congolense IL3000]